LKRLDDAWPAIATQRLSFANSAALLSGQAKRELLGDIARPGIMLYGASPWGTSDSGKTAGALHLQPVMTLKSQIIGVQQLAAGERVGYGGSFVAEHPMTVGVVACGYADGYPRHAGNQAPILVNGIRTQVIGRVSMDMLCCDLSAIPEASIGTPVTLWGRGLPADEVAEADIYLVYMDAFPESNIELSIAAVGLDELFAETWPTIRNILDATPMTNEETVRLTLLLSTTEDHWAYELIGILDMTAVPDNGLPSTTSYKIVPVEGDAQP
jgi:hypothetical protein